MPREDPTPTCTLYPPINFANVLHKPELKKASDPQSDISADVYSSYFNEKWTWRVGGSFKDVQALNQKIYGPGPERLIGSQESVSDSALASTNLTGSIWDNVDIIAKSKKYEYFLNALKELESESTTGKNYGVTVETTVDATKMSGDQKLRRLRKIMGDEEVFGVKRGDIQVMFHEEFIQACLSIIYRGEWDQNYDDIMKRNRVKANARERFVICPRRFGKTWSVAMFCAAFIWCMPNVVVSIFSRGKRMAQKLMFQILRYLMRLPGFKGYVFTSNGEQIILKFGSNDTRFLCCLPGTPEMVLIMELAPLKYTGCKCILRVLLAGIIVCFAALLTLRVVITNEDYRGIISIIGVITSTLWTFVFLTLMVLYMEESRETLASIDQEKEIIMLETNLSLNQDTINDLTRLVLKGESDPRMAYYNVLYTLHKNYPRESAINA